MVFGEGSDDDFNDDNSINDDDAGLPAYSHQLEYVIMMKGGDAIDLY